MTPLGSEHLAPAVAWNREFLAAEVRRIAYQAASLWYQRDFVPSVLSTENVEERLQRYLQDLGGIRGGSGAVGDSEMGRTLHEARCIQEQLCSALRRRGAARGEWLPFDRMVRTFDLDLFEEQVMLLALTQVVDSRLGWLISAFRGHEQLTAPNVALALALFADEGQKTQGLQAFLPSGRLRVHGLLLLGSALHPGRQFIPFQEREMHLPDWVLSFLLGAEELLPEHHGLLRLRGTAGVAGGGRTEPVKRLAELVLAEETANQLGTEILPALRASTGRVVVQLVGEAGTSRKSVAAALCAELGQRVAVLDMEMLADGGRPDPELLRTILAAVRLHGATLHVERLETLWANSKSPERELQWFVERLTAFPGRIFWSTDRAVPVSANQLGGPVLTCRLARPSATLRRTLWEHALPVELHPSAEDLTRLSLRFRFTAAEIATVAQQALDERTRTGQSGVLGEAELAAAGENFQSQRLRQFGELVRTRMTWKELILDEELTRRFEEVKLYARYRETLFLDWGFERRFSRGRGLSLLLTGPPGTGKTQSAELLAQDLQLPMFRVDVSRLVDKYIGETDKHMAELFEKASASGSILFFDEADSLFSRRVEVHTSTDRYANQSVNFLLQKIEDYLGIVILTTNLGEEIDPAFKRRLTFILEFKEPTQNQRAQIWKHSIPAEAPMTGNIDWARLGREYELTGGHIKNAVLRAALKAARDGTKISMKLLQVEASRELQARGRLVRE